MDLFWKQWLHSEWSNLVAGQKINVPSWLPPPHVSGFTNTELAEPAGQVRDWAMSFTDGSRVHVHEYPDGRLVAHRDATDPALGLVEAAVHWVTESDSGRLVAGLAMAALFIVTVSALIEGGGR